MKLEIQSNWIITLNQVDKHERQLTINWQENDADLNYLCILLMQLKYQVIEQVIMSNNNYSYYLLISYNKSDNQSNLLSISHEKAQINISKDMIDYILIFLLKRIANGVADVDHLDLELLDKSKLETLTLTVKLQNHLESVSEKEALRRLGL